MLIFIKEDVLLVSLFLPPCASLATYLMFRKSPEVPECFSDPFYKAVCRVSEGEFGKAKEFEDLVILAESALENREVAIALRPLEEWPKAFTFIRLYKRRLTNACTCTRQSRLSRFVRGAQTVPATLAGEANVRRLGKVITVRK